MSANGCPGIHPFQSPGLAVSPSTRRIAGVGSAGEGPEGGGDRGRGEVSVGVERGVLAGEAMEPREVAGVVDPEHVFKVDAV